MVGLPVRRSPGSTVGLTSRYVTRFFRDPIWPLAFIFAGYPVWWALGLIQPAILIACAAMSFLMLRSRPTLVPPGFKLWMLFLVWAALGVLVVQVNAPQAVAGAKPTRYLTWGVRCLWYFEATTVLLYVASIKKRISSGRIIRAFGAMFVSIVIGGLIGVVQPTLEFKSLVEYALPHGLAQDPFVSSMIHPVFAQRLEYLNDVQYRPSAPYPYANDWGINYACFLPLFVIGWCYKAARRRYVLGIVVLAVSVVPVVYSMNRGLWAAIIVMVMFAVFKKIRSGNFRLAMIFAICAVVVGLVIALSPLGAALLGRFSGHNSNDGRTALSVTAVESVASGSPIIGFGTTRDYQGSFYSIAGGSAPPDIGTQGFLWSFIFGHGLVGAVLGMAFFAQALWRYRQRVDAMAIGCVCSLIAFLLTSPIYDWSPTVSFAAMGAVALLAATARVSWRFTRSESAVGDLRPVAGLASRRTLAIWGLVGVLAGAGWQAFRGPTYVASVAIFLPAASNQSGIEAGSDSTLDTQARFIQALYPPPGSERDGTTLTVLARPETRILEIEVRSPSSSAASSTAQTIAQAAIQQRSERLMGQRTALQVALDRQANVVDGALARVDESTKAIRSMQKSAVDARLAAARLNQYRMSLAGAVSDLRERSRELALMPTAGGEVLGSATVHPEPYRWHVAIGSGIALGVLGSSIFSGLRRVFGPPLRKLSGTRLSEALDGVPAFYMPSEALIASRPAMPAPLERQGSLIVVGRGTRSLRQLRGTLRASNEHDRAQRASCHEKTLIGLASSRDRSSRVIGDIARMRMLGIELTAVVVVDC